MEKKILIVEDNGDLCDIYKVAFESQGFTVKIVNDGMNAMSALEVFRPDVVLLDIMMPFVSGHDVLKAIREKGNAVTIVVNSNLSQEEDVEKTLALGANYYCKKAEYSPKELVEKVENIITEQK
jgi:DNA-binding response OmpR family regulator